MPEAAAGLSENRISLLEDDEHPPKMNPASNNPTPDHFTRDRVQNSFITDNPREIGRTINTFV